MTLRERCKEFLGQQQRNAIMRVSSPVEDLMAFVIAETGRSADNVLEDTLPLCLYFGSKEDREEFMAAVHAWKPDMISKPMP